MPDEAKQAEVREEARKFVIENCLIHNPVVVLGSGASVKFGLPTMGGLKDAIVTAVEPTAKSDTEKSAWTEFKEILSEKDSEGNTTDLETAMQRAKLNEHSSLFDAVIDATWKCIATADQKVLHQYFLTDDEFPLSRLYRFLLKSQHRRVTVITPNYDRLAEYAADIAGLHYRTGFGGGILRDMRDLDTPLRYYRADLKSEERTIDIWKVHGSIDWFRINTGKGEKVRNLPLGLSPTPLSMPSLSRPVIVPPGRGKYEETHREPYRSCMREADRALNAAGAFLCVGYGFNDSHLQECLVRRCRDKAPVVLVTRDITPAARQELIDSKANAVVFSYSGTNGLTRIHTPNCREGWDVEGPDLWDFGAFLDFVLE